MGILNTGKHIVPCPHCGEDMLDHMKSCPHCKKEVTFAWSREPRSPDKIKATRKYLYVVSAVVIIIFVVLKFFN